jgi:tetratricopeptide (TPR) repeat protein
VHRGSGFKVLLATVLALACVLLPARSALADDANTAAPRPDEAKARAQVLFERGITAYKEGRFKDAIDAFLDAHREYPSPTLSFNAARAYEKMGDNAGALRFYREYLRQSPNASDKGRVDERVADLEKKLQSRGIQQVTVLSNTLGATVVLDGQPVGITPWTGEIAPGAHEVKLRREGSLEARGTLDLPADHAIDFQLDMKAGSANTQAPEAGSTNGKPVSVTRVGDEGTRKRGVSPWTWAAFGVGVAALSGAFVFEELRRKSEDDVKTEPTQIARHDAYDQMKSRQTTARVLGTVGTVAVLAGGVLLYFDLSSSDKQPSTRAGLGVRPGGAEATLAGHF